MKDFSLALSSHEKSLRCDMACCHWPYRTKGGKRRRENKHYHDEQWNVFDTTITHVCIMELLHSVVCWMLKVGDRHSDQCVLHCFV